MDMPAKAKIVTVGVFILLGAALFYYCAVFYPKESVVAQAKAASSVVSASPSDQVKAASPAICASESQPLEQTPSPVPSSAAAPSSSESRPRPRSGAT
jgi:hypothetical protein